MSKEFITYDQIRNNALKMASRIHREGFDPDVIYVSLRGGAYMANVISEYFKFVKKDKRPVFYAAVVARSYTDVKEHESVRIDGWTYKPEYLRTGDRILLIDDIFDSGRTLNYLVKVLLEKGIPRQDIKVVVHDYKVRTFEKDPVPVVPDYYCRKHVIESPEEDNWIHYMSHELIGLTEEELEKYYFSQDPELRAVFEEDFR